MIQKELSYMMMHGTCIDFCFLAVAKVSFTLFKMVAVLCLLEERKKRCSQAVGLGS